MTTITLSNSNMAECKSVRVRFSYIPLARGKIYEDNMETSQNTPVIRHTSLIMNIALDPQVGALKYIFIFQDQVLHVLL